MINFKFSEKIKSACLFQIDANKILNKLFWNKLMVSTIYSQQNFYNLIHMIA